MINDNNIFVSVIVPNYNHSQYLEKRINTILEQTYQNFEIILLDDCSTDDSLRIMNKYKNNEKVTKFIANKKNSMSPFKQWEKGLENCNGEWVWIAESDDYNNINFLESLIKPIKKYKNCVMAYSKTILVDEINNKNTLFSMKEKAKLIDGITFIKKRLSLIDDIPNASAVIFKKSAYNNISKEYTKYKSAGDRRFWAEIAINGDVYIDNHFYNFFRWSNNGVTYQAVMNGVNLIEDNKTYNFLIDSNIITENNIENSLRKSYVKHEVCSNKNIPLEVKNKIFSLWDINDEFKPLKFLKVYIYIYGFPVCLYNCKKSILYYDFWNSYNKIFHKRKVKNF